MPKFRLISALKKMLKLGLWICLSLIMLVGIFLVVLRIGFPPYKIKQMIISNVASTIGRNISVGTVWFNPFRGVTLNDICVSERAIGDNCISDTARFFSAKKFHLRYRFSALFKRKFEIKTILIDDLVINLRRDRNGSWNFADLIAADTAAARTQDTSAVLGLPISIDLRRFALNRLTANLFINQSDTIYTLASGGLSVFIENLFWPRISKSETQSEPKLSLRLVSDEQLWRFSMTHGNKTQMKYASSRLDMDLRIQLLGHDFIQSDGQIGINSLTLTSGAITPVQVQMDSLFFPKVASIRYDVKFDGALSRLALNELTAKIADETIFKVEGTVTDFPSSPNFQLSITESEIKLKNLINLLLPLLPDSIQQRRKQISIDGLASFAGSSISGNPTSAHPDDALMVNLLFRLDNFTAAYVDPHAKLINLNIRSRFTERHNRHGVQGADIQIDARMDSLFLTIDTLHVGFGQLQFNLNSALQADLSPDSIRAIVSIGNFFEVPLDFNFHFKSILGLDRFRAGADLNIPRLPLSNLPASALTGLLDLSANLKAETLDRIDLTMLAKSDEIIYETDTGPLIFNPLTLLGKGWLSTTATFERLELKQLLLKANDFATGKISGTLELSEPSRLELLADDLIVDHPKLMAYLPSSWFEGYETLSIGGRSTATASITAIIPSETESQIDVRGKVLINANVEYPDLFLSLKHVTGILNFTSDAETAQFALTGMLDSLIIQGVRDDPIRNMPLWAKVHMPDFETLKLDSAELLVQQLRATVRLNGQLDSLSGNMPSWFDINVTLDTQQDTIPALNDMRFAGKINGNVHVFMVGDLADISGQVNIGLPHLAYSSIAKLDTIEGAIQFALRYDIEREVLIESGAGWPFLSSEGSYYYDLLRPNYRQRHPQFSAIEIRRIRAGDYQARDIHIDLLFDNERINVPRFTLKAYDGNVAGLISANLHQGTLDQIEWRIKANVSQLNSAKLLPTRRLRRKGSELNLTMELSGVGLDPARKMDIQGNFYVTRIGPQFTDNVLRSLDPRGTDKSIQDTRRLLNWGYRPRLISFEIKHGNLYPTIHLVKGKLWTRLIPLNLSGGKIQLARIPIKFFMTNMMTATAQ
ncbi:MAG: AsmA family protein [candidate division KSB1 bacterium]|nr:AsmA family protein [candidate division KSB1 bacterium]